MQQVADCAVRGLTADALLAADIDRELDGVVGADVNRIVASIVLGIGAALVGQWAGSLL